MAHLYQRAKKGIWYAKFYRDGKQVLRSLKTTNCRLARNEALPSSSGWRPGGSSRAPQIDCDMVKAALLICFRSTPPA